MTIMSKALEHNNTIAEINLTQNCIEDRGVTAAGEMLKKNNKIININFCIPSYHLIDRNKIGDNGAACLARGLEKNTSVTALSLRNAKFYNRRKQGRKHRSKSYRQCFKNK